LWNGRNRLGREFDPIGSPGSSTKSYADFGTGHHCKWHSARLSGAGRKAAERERREAERKRSRLEAMYRNHLISSAAYKKGQDKYQSEIAKYRGELNGTASTNE